MWGKIDPFRLTLLTAFAILSILSLRGESPTWDEPRHLAMGFRFLKTLDANVIPQDHPPLLRAIAAVPYLIAGRPLAPLSGRTTVPVHRAEGEIREFFRVDDGANFRLFFWAKGMIVLVALLLGWLVYEVGRDAYGVWGARLALTLFVFDPNILAHARLVTTDIGITLGMFLFLVSGTQWADNPTKKRALLWGGALGVALLTKHSAISLLAFIPVLVVATLGRSNSMRELSSVTRGVLLAVSIAIGLVWGCFRFTVGPIQGGKSDVPGAVGIGSIAEIGDEAGDSQLHKTRWLAGINGLTVPAPEYVRGLRRQIRHVVERGHPTYLRGEHSQFGWKSYFPTAFLIKTPIPTLLFLLAMAASALWVPFRRWEIVFAAFALFLFIVAVKGSLNIGLRHLLPIYPPLFVLVGRLASPQVILAISKRFKRAPKWIAALLLVWLVVGTGRIHPHYLAYFNESIGGPKNGWRYLVGPDLDWGQDLQGLAGWMRANHVPAIQLSYYGTVDPALYGITWTPIQFRNRKDETPTLAHLEPGYYAVSTSNLVEVMGLGQGPMKAFQALESVATIGYSMNVYRIDPRTSSAADEAGDADRVSEVGNAGKASGTAESGDASPREGSEGR